MNKIFNTVSKNSIVKSISNNYGEVFFRLTSKFFLILFSLIVNTELFGSLVLIIVLETIITNVLRFGQDRRLLSLINTSLIPLKEYCLLTFITLIFCYYALDYLYSLNFLFYVIPFSILSSIFFLINVKNRIINLKVYNKLKIYELCVRFVLAPLGLMFSIKMFVVLLILLYFLLILLALKNTENIFTFNNDNTEDFWRFAPFAIHSAIAFLLAGIDKILISTYLGIEVQGEYSQLFSIVSLISIIYLFLSFVYEPKFYNSVDLKKIETTYLKLCYVIIIPFGLFIYFVGVKLDLIYNTNIFILLFLFFLLYPLEFSKIYIQTRRKKIKRILFSGAFQLILILVINISFDFSILLLVTSLVVSKTIGLIILNEKISE